MAKSAKGKGAAKAAPALNPAPEAADPFDFGTAHASKDKLATLIDLANQQIHQEELIALMTEELAEAGKRLNALRQVQIPEAMAELGLADFTLADGSKLTVKAYVSGSLPKEEAAKDDALEWLEDNGGEGLIKTTLTMAFGKSQHNEALALLDELRKRNIPVDEAYGVHAASLQSFAKEKLANGEEIPLEKLGLNTGRVSKITAPKIKKGAV